MNDATTNLTCAGCLTFKPIAKQRMGGLAASSVEAFPAILIDSPRDADELAFHIIIGNISAFDDRLMGLQPLRKCWPVLNHGAALTHQTEIDPPPLAITAPRNHPRPVAKACRVTKSKQALALLDRADVDELHHLIDHPRIRLLVRRNNGKRQGIDQCSIGRSLIGSVNKAGLPTMTSDIEGNHTFPCFRI